jgi:hypothetical protein
MEEGRRQVTPSQPSPLEGEGEGGGQKAEIVFSDW